MTPDRGFEEQRKRDAKRLGNAASRQLAQGSFPLHRKIESRRRYPGHFCEPVLPTPLELKNRANL